MEWYIPMPFGFVLFTKNKFGIIEKISDNSVILLGEYFYLGGSGLGFSESLRGYDDGQVGPLNHRGSPLGGKTMFKTSRELRFPISPNPTIFGLFFAEGGNAWETLVKRIHLICEDLWCRVKIIYANDRNYWN